MFRALPFLLLSLLVLDPMSSAAADEARVVEGTIRDVDGTPLFVVDVRAVDPEIAGLTGRDGTYRLTGLPAEQVTLRFRRLGFRTVVREVDLRDTDRAVIDVTMEVSPLLGEEVVVTANARAKKTVRTVRSTDVIASDAVRQHRSASLGDLLASEVAGVSNVSTGSQAGKPVLRGLTGLRIRSAFDGVADEYYQYGIRHHPTTSLLNVDRVEVVRGPASLLFGSDALGGAINMRLKPIPSATGSLPPIRGRVGGHFYSNNGERAGEIDLAVARGAFGARFGIERRVGDEFETPDATSFFESSAGGSGGDPKYTGEIPFTDFEQWSTFASAGVKGERGSLRVSYDHWSTDENFLLPGGGPVGSATNPPQGIGVFLRSSHLRLDGNWLLDGFAFEPTLQWQRAEREANAPGAPREADADPDVDLQRDVITARLEAIHVPLRGFEGTLGLEFQTQDGESRGPVALEPESELWNLALFAFEEFEAGRVTWAGGLRYDHRSQEASPNALTEDPDRLEQTYDEMSGSIGANVLLIDGLSVAANVNSGFRAPSVFELYANGVHGGVAAFQRGRPDLDSERSLGAELSLRASRARLQGEATVYRNSISDYVYLRDTGEVTGNDLPVFESDQTDAVIQGVEGHAEFAARPWLAIGGHFSVVRGEGDDVLGPDGELDADLPVLPADHVGAHVTVSWPQWKAFRTPRARARLRRVFEKDASGPSEPFAQFDRPGTFGTASTDAYTLLGFDLSTTLELGANEIDLAFEVRNLLDEKHRDFLDTYKGYVLGRGRDLRLRMSVPFDFAE